MREKASEVYRQILEAKKWYNFGISMDDFPQILKQAYNQFILNVEGKKVAIPYRINIPPIEHPARQGKSAPEVILNTLYEDAKEQNFDLKSASSEEIREFMKKNNLGLDCSGFVYRMLDFLVQEVKGKPLTELGFDHVGRTNVAVLADNNHTIKIDLENLQPGDIVKTNSVGDIDHVLIVIGRNKNKVTYAHSSRETNPQGVHKATFNILPQGEIKFIEDLGDIAYNITAGDGPRRLKALL